MPHRPTLEGSREVLDANRWEAAPMRRGNSLSRLLSMSSVERRRSAGCYRGTLEGPTFALARMEVGVGPPAIRVVGLGDAGWAGASRQVGRASAVGAGLSLGEGLFRFDLAHPLERGTGFRFLLSGHGLL